MEHLLEIVIFCIKSSKGMYAADAKGHIANNNHENLLNAYYMPGTVTEAL